MSQAQNVYKKLRKISLKNFGNLFTLIQKSAFRLETLQVYNVTYETKYFKRFLAGENKPPKDINKQWRVMVRNAAKKGIKFSRVRLVEEPLTSYLKFEIAWGYSLNILAGEDIRVISSKKIPRFDIQVAILKDFWLFDDQRCYLMEYDLLGKFLGINQIPKSDIKPYIDLKYELIDKSKDIRKTRYKKWL